MPGGAGRYVGLTRGMGCVHWMRHIGCKGDRGVIVKVLQGAWVICGMGSTARWRRNRIAACRRTDHRIAQCSLKDRN